MVTKMHGDIQQLKRRLAKMSKEERAEVAKLTARPFPAVLPEGERRKKACPVPAKLRVLFLQEDDMCVVQVLGSDLAAQGGSKEQALEALFRQIEGRHQIGAAYGKDFFDVLPSAPRSYQDVARTWRDSVRTYRRKGQDPKLEGVSCAESPDSDVGGGEEQASAA